MSSASLLGWIEEHMRGDVIWYAKYLSANDTQATQGHQAGPYIQRNFLLKILPGLDRPEMENPRVSLEFHIDSHDDYRDGVNAIWYNNKLYGGTRNETRLTGLGGQASPLLDPDNTGALTLFLFLPAGKEEKYTCHVWISRSAAEEDLILEYIGFVEPGVPGFWIPDTSARMEISGGHSNCWLTPEQFPPEWLETFPSGNEVVRKSIELRPEHGTGPDLRLLRRRDCEYEIFQSLQEHLYLPVIREGFTTIDEFLNLAHTMTQRSRSRSGLSLELHTRNILIEENLKEDINFSYNVESEDGKVPDFLFPSASAYRDSEFPAGQLRMLAVKTSCRDRWRQILQEADRISEKHLLTLQEGVSERQFHEMKSAKVKLVVPQSLHQKYPESVRPELQTFESFIGDVQRNENTLNQRC